MLDEGTGELSLIEFAVRVSPLFIEGDFCGILVVPLPCSKFGSIFLMTVVLVVFR